MNELSLIKSESFGNVQCDFWKNENGDILMTIAQLAQALDYADKSGVEKIIQRNEYLKKGEFSTTDKLSVVEGERIVAREMRVFTEDGIYEVTMLAGTDKARDFRAWVRKILKGLSGGQIKIQSVSEGKKKDIESRYNNSLARKANILLKIANNPDINPRYRQVLQSQASAIVTGMPLLPLPEAEEKTYTAAEIGEILSISANMVGRITGKNNLKTPEYGKLFHDKSPYSAKEVETFRYYESVIPKIKESLDGKIVDIGG
jgi:prophage antirepressor-like protein